MPRGIQNVYVWASFGEVIITGDALHDGRVLLNCCSFQTLASTNSTIVVVYALDQVRMSVSLTRTFHAIAQGQPHECMSSTFHGFTHFSCPKVFAFSTISVPSQGKSSP